MKKNFIKVLSFIIILQFIGCTSIYRSVKAKRNKNYQEGVKLYKQNKYKDAYDRFETVASIDPEYRGKEVQRYIKRCEYNLKRKERAVDREIKIFYSKGIKYKRSRRYEAALDTFLALQKKDPDYEDVDDQIKACREKLTGKFKYRLKTAKKQYKRRQYKNAYKTCLATKKINPGDWELKSLMGDIENNLDKRSEKYLKRGKNLYSNKKYNAARKQLYRAISINPWSKDSKELLTKCNNKIYIKTEYDVGVKLFDKKNYYPAYLKFNSINRRERGYRATENYLNKIKKILNENIGKYFNRGISLYDKEEFQAAINEFNKVLTINPGHSKAKEYKERAAQKLEIKKSLGGN